jgi:hypothetical protein
MKASTENQRRIWAPLNLGNLDDKRQAADRLKILNLIREVYDPMLTTYLSIPGSDWRKQFIASKNKAMEKVLGKLHPRMPTSVKNIPEEDLALYLFDILRFCRFTDDNWTVPITTPSHFGITMNGPHPKAPEVVPWTPINAQWPVRNPPIHHTPLNEFKANEIEAQIEDTEEAYEEIDDNSTHTPAPTPVSPTAPSLFSVGFSSLTPSMASSRSHLLAFHMAAPLASSSALLQAFHQESRQVCPLAYNKTPGQTPGQVASRAVFVESLLDSPLVLPPITFLVPPSAISPATSSAFFSDSLPNSPPAFRLASSVAVSKSKTCRWTTNSTSGIGIKKRPWDDENYKESNGPANERKPWNT